MRPTRRRAAGMTMLEMMTVVALIGVLSGLSGAAISDMVRSGRVIASSKGFMTALGTVRLRAAATNCPHYVQVNGPTYAGTGSTGFPAGASTIALVRKGDCNSTVVGFEAGDRVVDQIRLGPDELPDSVVLVVPTSLLSAGELTNQSVIIDYDRRGKRRIAVDGTGAGETGFSEVTAVENDDLTLTLHERATTPNHTLDVLLPRAGAARVP